MLFFKQIFFRYIKKSQWITHVTLILFNISTKKIKQNEKLNSQRKRKGFLIGQNWMKQSAKVVQFCFILNYLQLSKGCKPLESSCYINSIFDT